MEEVDSFVSIRASSLYLSSILEPRIFLIKIKKEEKKYYWTLILDEKGRLFRFLYILSLFSMYNGTVYLHENKILHDNDLCEYFLLYDAIENVH